MNKLIKQHLLLGASLSYVTLATAQIKNDAPNYDAQKNSKRPNIVLIVAEDLGPRFGCYGDPVAKTPNIDAFAKEGVRFTNVFTMAGVSAPSRAGLITGMYQNFSGLQHMRTASCPDGPYQGVPPGHVKAYPELLRKSGYFTYNDVKTDYQFSKGAADAGPFTIWSKNGVYLNPKDLMVPAAWQNFDLQGKPFFLNLNPQITHESALFEAETAPDKFKGMVGLWSMLRKNYKYEPTDPKSVKIDPYWVDDEATRKTVAQFYDNIQIVDIQVGNIIKKLKEDGLWDNTIVIVTTDHGDALPRHKREGYNSGTQVPMLVHIPAKYRPIWFKPGTANNRLVSFEDLAPTILGFAKCEIPSYMQGCDLSKNTPKIREYTYASRGRMDEIALDSYFVTNKDFQYVRNLTDTPNGTSIEFRDGLNITRSLNQAHADGKLNSQQAVWYAKRPIEELYDLKADPFQLKNIAEDKKYEKVLNQFRAELDRWRNSGNDMNIVLESQMRKDLLDENGNQRITLTPVVIQDDVNKKIYISNRTDNASVGYSFDGGINWEVYNGSFNVPQGIKEIKVKAIKYGWKESDVTTFNIN